MEQQCRANSENHIVTAVALGEVRMGNSSILACICIGCFPRVTAQALGRRNSSQCAVIALVELSTITRLAARSYLSPALKK
jgi:hypothetical protein